MIFPDYTLEDFCKQHDLKPIIRPCRKCQALTETTIPFATRLSRGLMSKDHGCGEEYTLMVMKPLGELLNNINNIAGV